MESGREKKELGPFCFLCFFLFYLFALFTSCLVTVIVRFKLTEGSSECKVGPVWEWPIGADWSALETLYIYICKVHYLLVTKISSVSFSSLFIPLYFHVGDFSRLRVKLIFALITYHSACWLVCFFPKYFILQYKKRPGITKLKFQLKGFTSASAHSQHKKKEANTMHVVFELLNS